MPSVSTNTADLTVDRLLSGRVPHQYDDKVFWFANKIAIRAGVLELHVDNRTCVTAFRGTCELLDVLCVDELAALKPVVDWENGFGPVLVSSGVFLFINDCLTVTQRSMDTPVDPGLWTSQAGRCDRSPLQTALKECVEEISLFDGSGRWLLPEPTRPFAPDDERICYFPAEKNSPRFPLQTLEVSLLLDGREIERQRLWQYYSPTVNTLELRLPLFAHLNEDLHLVNPEFHTHARLIDWWELETTSAVPAVSALIKEMKNERK